ncbi:MAG: class I SAM-dependent methyltransferase [Acidobacteria bacterium]|nr:class I SAM-dependent methyltransferase [Acidobacteriota bacterium]
MTSNIRESGSAGRWGPLWGAQPDDWAWTEQQQIPTYEEVIRRVAIKAGERVLDVGCGAGTFLRMAADLGAQVFGFDASESLLDIARKSVPNADLRAGDMESLPYEDDSFDLVTGFNSFFYAADMVAALREAGRVAKTGAPVVIQVWGRPERCNLDALKRALGSLLPPTNPGAPPPPKLWERGVLEGIATEAGLTPESRFETSWAFQYPDTETMAQKMLAPGIVVAAVRHAGEAVVRAAIIDALAPYRAPEGAYRFENEWHYLIARAR